LNATPDLKKFFGVTLALNHFARNREKLKMSKKLQFLRCHDLQHNDTWQSGIWQNGILLQGIMTSRHPSATARHSSRLYSFAWHSASGHTS